VTQSKFPTALVLGCAGPRLTADERALFRDVDPLGFILFARNVESPDQVRALTAEFVDCVGRADAPVLVDQEGGRVQRLGPPHWRAAPPGARFAALHTDSPDAAHEAAYLNALLIARDLVRVGITVDCAPVLDVPQPGAHDVIGDRALGADPATVAALGRAVADGLLAGGVTPVIKHLPGHGRAAADSHLELPVVEASSAELGVSDFPPFRDLSAALPGALWAMTAHVVYTALDADAPATTSPSVIADVIRTDFGFDGVLVSDDIGMQALSGGFDDRARASLSAGCDVALHCSGDMAEMVAAAEGASALSPDAWARARRAETLRADAAADHISDADALARLGELLA